MDSLVFYCSNCKQTYAGEDYRASDRPCCPKCKKMTFSTGITQESWVRCSKKERQEILETFTKEDEQREKSISKRQEYAQTVGVTYTERDKENTDSSLDGLYIDIGKKIKGWAKWIFIVGAIVSAIGAFSMLFTAEDGWMIITAVFALVLGPVVAWVSSWILYAFGELVEKTSANEQNTRNILKLMLENNAQKEND